MAKPMVIIVHVEEIAFGKVWRMLDTMPGVAKLELRSESAAPKKATNPNGDHRATWRQPGGFNLRETLLKLLAKKSLHATEIRELATKNGRSAGGANSATTNLAKRKLIKTDRKGNWSITRAGKNYLAKMQTSEVPE